MSYAMGCASLGVNVIFSGLAVQMKIAPVWMSWMFYLSNHKIHLSHLFTYLLTFLFI